MIEKLQAALSNCKKALEYYNGIFAKPHQEARIRNESQNVYGLLKYKEYLETEIALIEEANKPKRGNPNFGKNNPWNEKQKAIAAAKKEEK